MTDLRMHWWSTFETVGYSISVWYQLPYIQSTPVTSSLQHLLSFPFPRFSFFIPPFLILLLLPNLLFILLLKAIAERSSSLWLLLVASIWRWVYLLYRLSKSIINQLFFSLLTRIATDDYCFKTKKENNATTGEHCFDFLRCYCHHHHHHHHHRFSEYDGMYH